jgi:hypothetical protein
MRCAMSDSHQLPREDADMAARRTELVKAGNSGPGQDLQKPEEPFVPGLREDTESPELLDDRTRELALSPEDILAEPPDARDIAAELAAPPRRKLPWLTLLLAGGVIAAGSFAGGALVEKNNGSSSSASGAAAAFAKLRSGSGSGSTGGFGGFGRGGSGTGTGTGSGAAGGTTTGTIKLIDGNTIYVTNSSGNIVKITTGGSTTVSIAKSGTVSQLQPGQTITARGTTDSSGNVTATTVTEGTSAGGGFGGGGFSGAGGASGG